MAEGSPHGGLATAERVPGHSRTSEKHASKKVEDEPLRFVLTSLDKNVDAFAKEAAHEKLSEKPEGRLLTRAIKNIWNNASREYKVVKETQRAREEILASGNLLHHHGKSDQKWKEAVVTRRSSDFGEELLREGETFHNLSNPEYADDPDAQRIRSDILNRVGQFARGEIVDTASLEEAHKRDREQWAQDGISQKFLGEGNIMAHNILAMGEQTKAALDNEEGLDAVDRDAKLEEMLDKAHIIVGEAKVGSQVEIESTLSERLAEKLKNVPFLNEGRLAKVAAFVQNEALVAGVLSVAAYGVKSGIGKAVASVAVPGLGGGIVAAVRGRKLLRQERALMARRMDSGDFSVPDKVDWADMTDKEKLADLAGMGPNSTQAELNEVMDDAKPVSELMAGIGNLYDDHGELKMRTREELVEAMAHLAEIKSRTETVDSGRRLISFAEKDKDIEDREDLRWDLDLAAAKLESDLKKLYENPVAKAMLDIQDDETYEGMSSEQRGLIDAVLKGEIEQKDKLFKKLANKEALKTIVGGTLLGSGVGAVVGGMGHLVSDPSPAFTQAPDIQNMAMMQHAPVDAPGELGGGSAPTELGSPNPSAPTELGSPGPTAPDQIGGNGAHTPDSLGSETTPGAPDEIGGSGGPEQLGTGGETHLSETATMNLPDGYEAQVSGDQLTVTMPDGSTLEGLQLNSDGSLTAEAQDTLKGAGLNVVDSVDIVNSEPLVSQQTVTAEAFTQNHMGEMKTIDHQGWMDNGTPDPNGNELETQNGRDANGNIIIDVSGMASNGSFHGASGINWHEAAQDGLLNVHVSVSEGTQAHVFEIPIDPNTGQAVITPDNPAYALYGPDGMPTGGFQEINFNAGVGPNGVENVMTLSTVVGEHQDTFTDTVTTSGAPEAHHAYVVTEQPHHGSNIEPTYGTPITAPPTPPPQVIPLFARSRMGKAEEASTPSATSSSSSTTGSTSSTGSSTPTGGYRRGPGATPIFTVNPNTGPSSGAETSIPNGGLSAASPNTGQGANPGSNPNVGGNPNTEPNIGISAANPDVASGANPDAAGAAETGPKTNHNTDDKTAEYAKLNEEDRKFMADLDNEVATNSETLSGDFDFPGFRTDFKGRERVMAGRFMKQASAELGDSSDNATIAARALDLAKAAVGSASGELSPLFQKAVDALERSVAQIQKRAEREAKSKAKGGAGAGEAYLNDLDSETGRFPFSYTLDVKGIDPEIQKLVTRIYRDAKAQVLADKGPAPPLGTGEPNDPKTKIYNNYMRRVFRTAVLRSHPDQYEALTDEQKAKFNDAMRVLTQAQAAYK